jgi:hypothetical protein
LRPQDEINLASAPGRVAASMSMPMPVAIIDGLLWQGRGGRLVGIHKLINPPLVTLPACRRALENSQGILLLREIFGLGSMHLVEGKCYQGQSIAGLVFEPDEVKFLVF